MIRIVRNLPIVLAVLLGAGCSSTPQSYEGEDFAQNNTYFRTYAASGESVCDAGRRALLSQGYNIDKSSASRIEGRKNFQGEDAQHTQISFNIDCSTNDGAGDQSTVFANAVQDRYSIKKSSNSASVGLSVLGSVSMPIGSSADSLVKTASQTITRPKFYDGFFTLLEQFLPVAPDKSVDKKTEIKDSTASHGRKPARVQETPPARVSDPSVEPVPTLDPPDLNEAAKGAVGGTPSQDAAPAESGSTQPAQPPASVTPATPPASAAPAPATTAVPAAPVATVPATAP